MKARYSDRAQDQAVMDAALDEELAVRDREDAARYRQLQATGDEAAASAATKAEDAAATDCSTEALRTGLSKDLEHVHPLGQSRVQPAAARAYLLPIGVAQSGHRPSVESQPALR